MDEKEIRKYLIIGLISLLAILSFLIVKPLLTYILLGFLFAYIFFVPYTALTKKFKSETISALITVFGSLIIFVLPLLLMIPVFIKQLFNTYISLRGMDFSIFVFKLFPALANSQSVSAEVIANMSHFNAKISSILLSLFESTVQNIPTLLMGIVVLLFTFYFSLKEGSKINEYISIVLPVSKDQKKKLYEKFKQITDSVLFGHLIVGIVQGIIAGLAYFMFGIPNALLLMVLTTLISIIPVIGPWLVWIPVDIFLFLNGETSKGMQLLIFGLFMINWIETLLRPVLIAEKAEMNPAIALVGAMGGLYAFGIMGFIMGPLILAYLILIIEMYREGKTNSIVFKEEVHPSLEAKK
jgi:predicted PurR-regulated permease PerM